MTLTKSFLLLLIILSCSSFGYGPRNKLDAIIGPQISNGDFQSIIIGAIEEDNYENYFSYGYISTKNTKKPTPHNIYEIGSLSKVFTGLILSSLHLNGTLSINDSISSVLLSLKGTPAGKITLIELATHMSGLARIPNNLTNINLKDPYANYSEEMLLSYLKSLKDIKKPKVFSWKNYSNTGFGLLGYILQKKTNLTYEELVKKYITKPLGMKNTYVNVPRDKRKFFVPGHNELLAITPYWLIQNSMSGAGALKSTASDLMLFLKANISPKNTKIRDVLEFSQLTRYKDQDKGIGIAWALKLENDQVESIGHNGGTGGFVSDLQFDVNKKKGFFYLSNTSSSPQCISRILIKSEECIPKLARHVKDQILDKYLGSYSNKKTGIKFVLSKFFNQLTYSIPGQETGKTTSISDTEFSIKGIASIRFNQGDAKFEFEQGGAKLIFTKDSKAN